MTPGEALNLLDQAASSLQLSRDGHLQIQQASAILSNFIAAQEKENLDTEGPKEDNVIPIDEAEGDKNAT